MQLRQDDDEMVQLEALSQLNELLSISNEESLSVFPVEQLVPVLVPPCSPELSTGNFCKFAIRSSGKVGAPAVPPPGRMPS